MRRTIDLDRLPVDILRAPQREMQHARADGAVGDLVDQDEAAKVAVGLVGLERDRPVQREVADADLVELQRLGRQMLQRVDVDLVFQAPEPWRKPSACRSSAR